MWQKDEKGVECFVGGIENQSKHRNFSGKTVLFSELVHFQPELVYFQPEVHDFHLKYAISIWKYAYSNVGYAYFNQE